MRNSYLLLFTLLAGMLLSANTSRMEGSTDDIAGVKSSGTQGEVKPLANKSVSKMDAVIKQLISAGFSNSPVVLNAAVFSTVTATWTGNISSDWNNTGNWMDGVVPTSTDIVSIPNVVNDPIIMNGTNATAQSVMVEEGASLTIAATGSLSLEGATGTPSGGMHNLGTITNNGSLQIGMNISPGEYGLVNEGVFQNNSGGELSVDRTSIMGIWNRMETSEISNAGTIVTGATNGTGGAGIYNEGSIQNNGGEITIDRAGGSAIDNRPNSNIENSGKITIGETASITGTGIYNFGTFQNLVSGVVEVDRVGSGIFNNTMSSINSAFINEGKIMIGQVASISGPGIYNNPSGGGSISFDNKVSGEIMLDRTSAGIHNDNNCTFDNSGIISVGTTAQTGFSPAIFNKSTFNNKVGGELLVDAIMSAGLQHEAGTFTNGGNITVGINTDLPSFRPGVYIGATFINQADGEINVDRLEDVGFYVTSQGSLTNGGLINIGKNNSGGRNGFFNSGNTTNQASGEIHIDNIKDASNTNGLYHSSNTFTNEGKIYIGNVANASAFGIFNQSTFNNSGEISIDRCKITGLRHNSNTFTNNGSITLGSNASNGDWGLWNAASFTNSGEIVIDNATVSGLRHQSNTFTNTGSIILGSIASIGEWGFWSQASFLNEGAGVISIDRSTNTGLLVFLNTFSNNGTVNIGEVSSVGDQAIYIEGSFENNNCGQLNIFAPFHNANVFSNFGLLLSNTGGIHINPGFTNEGIIAYPQGNPIPEVTNNEIIIAPTTNADCQVISPAFELAASVEMTILGVYTNVEGTISAGSYDMMANAVTTLPVIQAGVYDLFVRVEDENGGCVRMVPWQLTTEDCCDVPVAVCQNAVAVLEGGSTSITSDDIDGGSTADCGIVSMEISQNTFACSDVGTPQTVTLTVTDTRGNIATCNATVTVVDNTPPTVECFNQSVTFNGEVSIPLDSEDLADGDDNCGVQSIDLSPTSISSSQVGQTVPVEITVTDLSNNTATCTSQITVGGLPSGWSQNANGVGCADGNNIDYNTSNGTWTATSTNCYYTPPYTSDASAFAQYSLCGNGSITAQVTGISGTSLGWAGVVMRETNAPGAKKAQLTTNMSNFSRREFRTTTNGASFPKQFPSQNRRWLRIVRSGNQFAMYVSPNGVNWAFAGAQTIQMNSCIQIGLVVSNYSSNSTVTANFANVSVFESNLPVMANSDDLASFDFIEDRQSVRDVKVYPNPTSGQLNIALTGYEGRPVTLEVYNTMGQMLYVKEVDEVQNADEIIDLSSVASGMYLIRVSSDGLPAEMKRVTVAR